MPQKQSWFAQEIQTVFAELKTNEKGLTVQDAEHRLLSLGPNRLPEGKKDNSIIIFLRQFQSPLIYILLAASIVIYLTGETIDAVIILIVLLFNAAVGTFQEGKAQNTLQALKTFTKSTANVLRAGETQIVSDEEIVPGDIILLNDGEKIPADARVVLANNLKVDEASLTGESQPVYKFHGVIKQQNVQVVDQHNMVFKGTHVVAGSGRAVVTETGTSTVIGEIATKISNIDAEMPLKQNIRSLSLVIIGIVVAMSLFLFVIGVASGNSLQRMFATVVSLSVSLIPEGLPIVITLVLAAGVWRMSKRNALVKKLQAVEALGQAQVIAVDKTGTITKNEMVVQKVYTEGKYFTVSGVGYQPQGKIRLSRTEIDPANHPEILRAGKIAAFCGGTFPVYSTAEKRWQVIGDPTEAALVILGKKVGFHKNDLENESRLLKEIPFDYVKKFKATLRSEDGNTLLAVVGAPEVILQHSESIFENGSTTPLGEEKRDQLEKEISKMSAEGMRVLGFAERTIDMSDVTPEEVTGLTFGGFFAMKDALRPRVREAVIRATRAGIRVIMITGDNAITARAIATDAAIYHKGDEIVTGQDMETLSDAALMKKVKKVSVFARVTPEHKLRIIRIFQKRREVIAMTGDGVNDAPSLVAADLGISMGKIGTEVARSASDIVLLDDHFDSIVSAVEEGRNIYKTIKKVILYLFSTGLGEALTITAALILGYPLPVLAAQIIWLNFVTDGFLDVALAMEPKEKNLLVGTFEKPKKYLIDGTMGFRMLTMSVPMMIGSLYIFHQYYQVDLVKAQTMALTTLAVFQWFNAWNCRSETKSLFVTNPFSNTYLVGATITIFLLHLLAVYNPLFQSFLHTTPLTIAEWLKILPMALSIIVVEEIRKFLQSVFTSKTKITPYSK